MALYKLVFKASFYKDIKTIPRNTNRKIIERIDGLADNPRPFGCEKMFDQPRYRIKQGDYRILYTIDDDIKVVRVLKVGHRRDVYLAREIKTKYDAMKKKSP